MGVTRNLTVPEQDCDFPASDKVPTGVLLNYAGGGSVAS